MITAPTYQGKTIGVFGLARTGVAAVHSLVASGATVWAWDDKEVAREAVAACAHDLYAADFSELDALMLAPGVPTTHPAPHPLVSKAMHANVPVISDLDVFERARPFLPDHKTVAITGTNGKSTTTTLIGHLIDYAHKPVAVGGNIGTGLLSLSPLSKGGTYVFELSSFQLELTQAFEADVAVLLNITPDHLDRHGSMASYVAAKKRLFDMQDQKGVAVISVDDEHCAEVAANLSRKVVPISVKRPVNGGVYVIDGMLIDDLKGTAKPVGDLRAAPALQGAHNWQNAAASYAVGRQLGLKRKSLFAGLLAFSGLAHRQEPVPYLDGISVINDSKATNVDAAVRALETYSSIRWIAGGRAKDKDFSGLSASASSVVKAYLMGEDGPVIEAALPAKLPRSLCKTLEEATQQAIEEAQAGDTVLLSPACTAFDQFLDFEKRGEVFKQIIAKRRASKW